MTEREPRTYVDADQRARRRSESRSCGNAARARSATWERGVAKDAQRDPTRDARTVGVVACGFGSTRSDGSRGTCRRGVRQGRGPLRTRGDLVGAFGFGQGDGCVIENDNGVELELTSGAIAPALLCEDAGDPADAGSPPGRLLLLATVLRLWFGHALRAFGVRCRLARHLLAATRRGRRLMLLAARRRCRHRRLGGGFGFGAAGLLLGGGRSRLRSA